MKNLGADVAADFTKYGRHAVQKIQRHIELLRYRRFGDDLLLLKLAYANNGTLEKRTPKPQGPDKSFAEIKASLPEPLLQTLAALEDLVQYFGDDVQCKELRLYNAFKTLRNFASVVLQRSRLLVYLHLDAAIYTAQIQHHIAATRDVSVIGHWGTGVLGYWRH